MKTMYDIRELAAKITEAQAQKADYVTSTANLAMLDGLAVNEPPSLAMRNGAEHRFGINDHAHGQIASRLDIPRKYYARMQAESPALLATNVNTWLQKNPERRMVRTLGGTVRAFLSDRYMRVENEQIAEVALPILAEIPDVQFVSTALTETNLYIKAVAPRVAGEVRKGDVVQAGVCVRNSEVGAGAVVIEPFVYRLVCLNGATMKDSRFRAHHLGARVSNEDAISGMLTDEAIAADDNALMLRVRDVLRAAVSQKFLDACIGKMRDAAGDMVTGDVPAAIEVLAAKVALTRDESSSVLRHLIVGGDLSRYGVMNAVTRFSQDVDSYDRASELEAIGGKIIDLPRRDWTEIAEARAA